jgi:hypothetical protein
VRQRAGPYRFGKYVQRQFRGVVATLWVGHLRHGWRTRLVVVGVDEAAVDEVGGVGEGFFGDPALLVEG